MRSVLLFLLLILFSTSCGLFNRDKGDDVPEKTKIQKNSVFKAECQQKEVYNDLYNRYAYPINCFEVGYYRAKCSSGQVVCGTQPGSSDIQVYCIDKDELNIA